jgi:hypothetical protein
MAIQFLTNPKGVDHTRKTPEVTKKVEHVAPQKQADPAVPQKQEPTVQPPSLPGTASWNLKPGTYTPGGPPKMRDVSFDTHVDYHRIPPRQSHDCDITMTTLSMNPMQSMRMRTHTI